MCFLVYCMHKKSFPYFCRGLLCKNVQEFLDKQYSLILRVLVYSFIKSQAVAKERHTVWPRSLEPFFILSYFINGSRLFGHILTTNWLLGKCFFFFSLFLSIFMFRPTLIKETNLQDVSKYSVQFMVLKLDGNSELV